ncbi:fatty acyl-AMP ligase [Rhodococcus pyridinivorans]
MHSPHRLCAPSYGGFLAAAKFEKSCEKYSFGSVGVARTGSSPALRPVSIDDRIGGRDMPDTHAAAPTTPDLVARLEYFATTRPDAIAVEYVDDRGHVIEEQTRTWSQLHRTASATGSDLLARHDPRDRVLILTAPGLGFLNAFLGCLYAGMIAVPAPLPTDEKGMSRLARIVTDAGVSEIITTTDLAPVVEGWLGESMSDNCPSVGVIETAVPDETLGSPSHAQPFHSPDAIAFLQYTSGSTSDPKGVMVTRRNLAHNLAVIDRASRLPDSSTVAGWLPHFHDMGLIGQILYPLFGGHRGVHMSPATFLKRPHLWLKMLSDFRAAGTVAPNFAFDMCVRRVTEEQIRDLDLSKIRTVLNGSEPIRAQTLRAFADRFAGAGLAVEALCPCYGLAESTLMVTSDDPEPFHVLEVDEDALAENRVVPAVADGLRSLVSCGRAEGLDVAIVDPRTEARMVDGRIGEIRVRGASVAAGYWNNAAATAETFERTVDGLGGYLCTGDLGAFVDGRLYVTGRAKDVIIVNGRNLYPQDIEHSSREAHPALAGGLAAAFGTGENDGRIVVVQEVADGGGDANWADVRSCIRERIRLDHGAAVAAIILTPRKTVSRTTSGKIRRAEMRTRFLDGAFDEIAIGSVLGRVNA